MEKYQILDSISRKKSLQLMISTSNCTYYRSVDATLHKRVAVTDYKELDGIEISFIFDIRDAEGLEKAKKMIDLMNEA